MAATYSVALGQPISTRSLAALQPPTWSRSTWQAVLLLLTAAMLLIHGYHPFAEDGGVYLAGIEYRLDPSLFPQLTPFVTAHLHYSVFSYIVAGLVRFTHIPLPWALLAVYVFSLWLTLFAARSILKRCGLHPIAQFAGLALLATWGTLPVAGTSLVWLDPYLTARSLSTPLSLLAIGFALDSWPIGISRKQYNFSPASQRSLLFCLVCLLLAASLHPLMAAYAAAMIVGLRCTRSPFWRKQGSALAAIAVFLAAVLQALAPSESPAVVLASVSRYYWYLSQWQWYELCGLAGPIGVLFLILRWNRNHTSQSVRDLCRTSILGGCIATLVNLLFAHRNAPTHLVARLQPLRIFLLIYALMTILLAAALAQRLLATRLSLRSCSLVLTAVFLANAAILFGAQRATYPASQHLEMPWRAPTNAWSQAFLWIRDNTPKKALFALDADYITQPGEDAQTFRATAQRSALPDFSKDGGEASITPGLAQLWLQGVATQTNLSLLDDTTRDTRLKPLGVTWMVLKSKAPTRHTCPYRNTTVKVCQVDR